MQQQTNAIPHITAHNSVRYTAQQIAQEFAIADSTVRTRWLPWLIQVAPIVLLRDDGGYTELAHTLFSEFAKLHSTKAARQAWVSDAKHRYAPEWSSAGVIEGELVPDEVGGTLALLSSQNLTLQAALDADRSEIQDFINQLNTAEADFTDQELEAFKKEGIKRGLLRFKLEAQYEVETVNALRQQRLQGKGGDHA